VGDHDGPVGVGQMPFSWPGGPNSQQWDLKTITTFRNEKNHDVIDVIKMDVEGGEWWALIPLLQSGIMAEGKVRQLILEFHFQPDVYRSYIHTLDKVEFERVAPQQGNRDDFAIIHAIEEQGMKLWKWQWNVFSHCCIEASFIYQP